MWARLHSQTVEFQVNFEDGSKNGYVNELGHTFTNRSAEIQDRLRLG